MSPQIENGVVTTLLTSFLAIKQTKKWNVANNPTDPLSIGLYDQNGPADYFDLVFAFQEAFNGMLIKAGQLLTQNLQDWSVRVGLSRAGWKPALTENQAAAEAIEWALLGKYHNYPISMCCTF